MELQLAAHNRRVISARNTGVIILKSIAGDRFEELERSRVYILSAKSPVFEEN